MPQISAGHSQRRDAFCFQRLADLQKILIILWLFQAVFPEYRLVIHDSGGRFHHAQGIGLSLFLIAVGNEIRQFVRQFGNQAAVRKGLRIFQLQNIAQLISRDFLCQQRVVRLMLIIHFIRNLDIRIFLFKCFDHCLDFCIPLGILIGVVQLQLCLFAVVLRQHLVVIYRIDPVNYHADQDGCDHQESHQDHQGQIFSFKQSMIPFWKFLLHTFLNFLLLSTNHSLY